MVRTPAFSTSVSSVLGQATATGYVVSANAPIFAQGAPQSAATAALFNQFSCNPCVTLGLSNALKAQFTSLVPWNSPGGIGPNPYPNSGANASTQHGETFQYTFSLPGQAAVTYAADTLLDSGTRDNDLASSNPALGTSPYLNTNTGNIQAGTTVTLTGCTVTASGGCVPSAGSTSFTTTDSPDINVTYQVPNPNQSDILPDNTIGIGFFLLNSVLYNLAGEAIGYSPFFVTAAPLTTTSSAPIVIDATAGPLGLAGVISGPGPVTIAGGGSAQLSNVNTYTGLTTIQLGGQLYLAGPGSIASSAGLAANGTFDISRAIPAIADGGSGCVCIADLTGSGSVYLGAQNLTITNAGSAFGNGDFSGTIADGGAAGGTGEA
jgi:subtilase-type serine protease